MKFTIALLALPLSACGTKATYTSLAPHPYGAHGVQPANVALITQTPDREHVEIGIIEAGEASVYAHENTDSIFRRLRIEGAKRGCDAVLIRGSNHKAEYDPILKNSDSVDGWWGACLVFAREGRVPLESSRLTLRRGQVKVNP